VDPVSARSELNSQICQALPQPALSNSRSGWRGIMFAEFVAERIATPRRIFARYGKVVDSLARTRPVE